MTAYISALSDSSRTMPRSPGLRKTEIRREIARGPPVPCADRRDPSKPVGGLGRLPIIPASDQWTPRVHDSPPPAARPPPPDMREVDAVIRRRLTSDVAWSTRSASTSSAPAASASPDAGDHVRRALGFPARSSTNWPPRSSSSTPPRCCMTTSSTSPACAAAGRPPTPCSATPPACWSAISCIRALPDDGVGQPDARSGRARRRHQRHRRRRGAAADEHARP